MVAYQWCGCFPAWCRRGALSCPWRIPAPTCACGLRTARSSWGSTASPARPRPPSPPPYLICGFQPLFGSSFSRFRAHPAASCPRHPDCGILSAILWAVSFFRDGEPASPRRKLCRPRGRLPEGVHSQSRHGPGAFRAHGPGTDASYLLRFGADGCPAGQALNWLLVDERRPPLSRRHPLRVGLPGSASVSARRILFPSLPYLDAGLLCRELSGDMEVGKGNWGREGEPF